MKNEVANARELSAQEVRSVSGGVSLTTPLQKSHMTVRELGIWVDKYVNTMERPEKYEMLPGVGMHDARVPVAGGSRRMP